MPLFTLPNDLRLEACTVQRPVFGLLTWPGQLLEVRWQGVSPRIQVHSICNYRSPAEHPAKLDLKKSSPEVVCKP